MAERFVNERSIQITGFFIFQTLARYTGTELGPEFDRISYYQRRSNHRFEILANIINETNTINTIDDIDTFMLFIRELGPELFEGHPQEIVREWVNFYFESNIKNRGKIIEVDPEPDEDCPICLKKLDDNVVKLKNCKHKFHNSCILRWGGETHLFDDATGYPVISCPICRTLSFGTKSRKKVSRKKVSRKKVSRRKSLEKTRR